MKDFNYIDDIVKNSIGNLKVTPDSSWEQIQNTLNNTPKAQIQSGGNFFSSIFTKIAATFAIIVGIVSAIFFFGKNNNKDVSTQKPVDVTIEILVSREANVTVETDYLNDNTVDNQQITDNNQQNINTQTSTDTSNQIIIINVETTEIDTLHNN